MFDWDNTKVISDTELVFALKTPYPDLPTAMCQPTYSVFSEAAVKKAGGQEAVSTSLAGMSYGKYKFKEGVLGQYVLLERNDNYYDKASTAKYKYMRLSYNSDPSARIMALQAGDADVIINIPMSQVEPLQSAGYNLVVRDSMDVISIFLNCSKAPFDNEKVRQAFAMLINCDAVRAVAYNNFGTNIQMTFGPNSPYYYPVQRKPDPVKAKALLAEAGYPNGFDFTLNCLQYQMTMAQVIQANLKDGGINVNLNGMDFPAYIQSRMSGSYEANLGTLGTTDYIAVLRSFDGRLPPPVAFGGCMYKDTTLYAMIDSVYAEIDDTKRKQQMDAISKYLMDKGVAQGICSIPLADAMQGNLTGLLIYDTNYVDTSSVGPAQ
jgi:ABC-type transport system substrate-binding protein